MGHRPLSSKEPGQRYSSTADLAQHLRDIRDHISEVVTTDSMGEGDTVPGRKRRWWAAAAALLLLAAGTGARAFLVARMARPPRIQLRALRHRHARPGRAGVVTRWSNDRVHSRSGRCKANLCPHPRFGDARPDHVGSVRVPVPVLVRRRVEGLLLVGGIHLVSGRGGRRAAAAHSGCGAEHRRLQFSGWQNDRVLRCGRTLVRAPFFTASPTAARRDTSNTHFRPWSGRRAESAIHRMAPRS